MFLKTRITGFNISSIFRCFVLWQYIMIQVFSFISATYFKKRKRSLAFISFFCCSFLRDVNVRTAESHLCEPVERQIVYIIGVTRVRWFSPLLMTFVRNTNSNEWTRSAGDRLIGYWLKFSWNKWSSGLWISSEKIEIKILNLLSKMNENDMVEAPSYSIIEFLNSTRKWLWYIYEELLQVVEPGFRELVNNAWDRQPTFYSFLKRFYSSWVEKSYSTFGIVINFHLHRVITGRRSFGRCNWKF